MNMKKLREIVLYAYNHTVFYKRLYDKNSIDVTKLESIQQIPIVTPQDLIDFPHDFKSDESIYKVVMTSGTVSNPKIIYRTISDFNQSVSNECLFLEWAGVTNNDSVCIVQPFGINGYGEITLEACKRLGIFTIPVGDVNLDELNEIINHFSPSVLDITPSKLYNYLKLKKDYNSKIRLAMIAGEQVNIGYKDAIKQEFGIDVINQYGSTEFDCLAAEKIECSGLHILSDSFIYEVIDGKLVITSLYHHGTPLIRYQIGDLANLTNNIISIHGREQSIQLYDGVILDSFQINSVITRYNGIYWQCLVYKKKKELCLELRVICNSNTDLQSIQNEFYNSFDFRDLIDSNQIQFSCQRVTSIVGEERKAKYFIDTRKCSDKVKIDLIKARCFEAFYFSLPPVTDHFIKKFISNVIGLDTEILLDLSVYIIHFWNTRSRKLGCEILSYCYNVDSKATLSKLCQLAKSTNWEIREEAAKVFACLIISNFQRVYPWIQINSRSQDEYLRRAILVAIKYSSEYINDDVVRSQLFDLMDYYLFDESKYVRKSFASFTIGDGFLNVCPSLVEKKLDSWLSLNNPQVNCVIIRVFKSSGGIRSWPLAQKYLLHFSNNLESEIVKALKATENYLKSHNAKEP